ncbi:Disulfide bond formation protein D precursor [Roseivivax sp. THAF40]|uniref:DsbA family protein n=1 Tax=unclassified Roseivivax TaxID=2639302 RepID=UPI001267A6EA|nr:MULTISPECIES: DsbA family protein [unclassified Roseivivax]QFS83398.1 Disulfide bond formation protein D precursor [Roseivivax sp. THAF197b]QFT47142.1 Disulfide bond formation protein D precursor [Roseivivax sp. THAF40]
MFKSTLTALALVTAGAGAVQAQGFDITDMTDAEREAFRSELRDYLMENPQVIIEAVNALEARQAAQAEAAAEQALASNAAAIKDDGVSWVGGNPDGDITVVEFMDYRCGYCRRAAPEVEELVASDGNIRFVIKEFPILGEASLVMSRFAIATQRVAGDEAYKQVHDTLMALTGEPTEPVLRRVAEELLLDADAIIAEMDSDSVTRQIAETRALADQLQIRGTPTFVMGDALVRGYVTLDEMRGIVAEERGEG